MENTKFLTDRNKRPNVQIPDGCKLHFNETTGRWALRNCKGFSAKYLKRNSFVPHSKYEEIPIEPLFEDDVNTINGRSKKNNSRNSVVSHYFDTHTEKICKIFLTVNQPVTK